MAIDKIFKSSNVDDLADNILSEVDDFMVSVDKMQQRKVAGNVQKVIQAFKQIETDLQDRYDNVTDVLEKRVSTIKDGRDGVNGNDGRSGRDGKPGRDGVNGKQGPPGTPGKDGEDGVNGVSVTNANIDFDGSLVISLSTGEQINVGEVVPPELERQLVELRQGGGSAGSSGDVAGPTSSTDNAIVRFDGTTGKLVQNSVVTIADTGNTNFAQTPVLYSGDGTVQSGRLLGRYSYRTATPTTAYFYDFNNSNTITSADSLFASKLATLINSTVTNANALTAFGTSYGTKAAGLSFISGTASDILLASVASPPLLNDDINAVVVGYTSVGPRIAIQNYALNDDTANAINYVGAVHRFYPAGSEVVNISTTGLAVTGAATVSTTLGVTGVSTLTAGAVVQGMTVGLGAGAIATNTAVGASALAGNASGASNVALGYQALTGNTTASFNTAVGYQAAFSVATFGASDLVAVGSQAAYSNTTGIRTTAIGCEALYSNTIGGDNTAVGHEALYSSTTGQFNTAVGQAALTFSTKSSNNTAVGVESGRSTGKTVTAGSFIVGGSYTILVVGTTSFTSIGASSNTVGISFTATGAGSGNGTATGNAEGNTYVGFQSGYDVVTGKFNTLLGRSAGLALTTGSYNVFIGGDTGGGSGSLITSGSKNSILGNYNGNEGGLDIRTASNYVVLSDGDGNPRAYWNGANATFNGSLTATGLATTGAITGDTLVLSGAAGALNAVSISANNDLTANNASIATFIAMSGGVSTIASTGTIAPTKEIAYISGTAAITTITPQSPILGTNGTIILIPTGAFTWTTAGNIAIAGTAVVGRALHMTFTNTTGKWYPSYV